MPTCAFYDAKRAGAQRYYYFHCHQSPGKGILFNPWRFRERTHAKLIPSLHSPLPTTWIEVECLPPRYLPPFRTGEMEFQSILIVSVWNKDGKKSCLYTEIFVDRLKIDLKGKITALPTKTAGSPYCFPLSFLSGYTHGALSPQPFVFTFLFPHHDTRNRSVSGLRLMNSATEVSRHCGSFVGGELWVSDIGLLCRFFFFFVSLFSWMCSSPMCTPPPHPFFFPVCAFRVCLPCWCVSWYVCLIIVMMLMILVLVCLSRCFAVESPHFVNPWWKHTWFECRHRYMDLEFGWKSRVLLRFAKRAWRNRRRRRWSEVCHFLLLEDPRYASRSGWVGWVLFRVVSTRHRTWAFACARGVGLAFLSPSRKNPSRKKRK